MSHPQTTFGMLNEIMLGLRVVLERQQTCFKVFYDPVDEHNILVGQGRLLRENETPHRARSPPLES